MKVKSGKGQGVVAEFQGKPVMVMVKDNSEPGGPAMRQFPRDWQLREVWPCWAGVTNLATVGQADICNPFVEDALGAPKGLTPLEHVRWSQIVQHPFRRIDPEMDSDLRAAVGWVAGQSAEVVDRQRRQALYTLAAQAASLQQERGAWLSQIRQEQQK